jgi:cob(I)alamin adenosyltransferase
MLQVYTGTGKGKTTAALGVAFRGAGYDLKTTMFSFLKDDPNYGEARAASLLPGFVLKQVGRDEFVNFYDPDPIDLQMVRDGWELAKLAIANREADIIILDELNIVLATNMLPTEEVAEFLAEHKNDVEIILTGRGAPLQIMNIADLVTDMKEVKHYFSQNVSSRNGIDH